MHDLTRRRFTALCVAGAAAGATGVVRPALSATPGQLLAMIERVEAEYRLPWRLLTAIALVETGRRTAAGAYLGPWPWALNIEGTSRFCATREIALSEIRSARAAGRELIDVGCMQINLYWHLKRFESLEAVIDPRRNVAYAAFLLREKRTRRGEWTRAVADYNASRPSARDAYVCRVMEVWTGIAGGRGDPDGVCG